MILALLSFYDEPPNFVRELVASLRHIGIRELVAVDGAYGLYPDGKPASPVACCKALRQAGYQNGVRTHYHAPETVWEGGEVEKRSAMFQIAEALTCPDDWYMRIDGDERVIQGPADLYDLLAPLEARAATAELIEPDNSWQSLRVFYRAERGIKVVGNHYTYELPDGARLYGDHNDPRVVPAAYTPVLLEHRNQQRPKPRFRAGLDYYKTRDATSPERHECAFCGAETPMSIPYRWQRNPSGLKGLRTGCCTDCYPQRSAESIEQAAAMGEDARHLFMGERVSVFR